VGYCPFLSFFAHACSSFLILVVGVVLVSSGRWDWRIGCWGLFRLLVGAYVIFASSFLSTR